MNKQCYNSPLAIMFKQTQKTFQIIKLMLIKALADLKNTKLHLCEK